MKDFRRTYPPRICNFQFSSSLSGGKLENHFTADESSGKVAAARFPPLGAEENWKINFTADESRGKAANARFPPLGAEENWKIRFTADESSGKAVIARFPPPGVEENWKVRVYRPRRLRQSRVSVQIKSQDLSISV